MKRREFITLVGGAVATWPLAVLAQSGQRRVGDAALAQTYAAQLIGLMPDVIVAVTTLNLEVVRQATSTVPVVFLRVSDPVAQGFVASLPKPGGNLTGFSGTEFSVGGKSQTGGSGYATKPCSEGVRRE